MAHYFSLVMKFQFTRFVILSIFASGCWDDTFVATGTTDGIINDSQSVEKNGCEFALEGWAAVNAEGTNGTSGGKETQPVRPESVEQLREIAQSDMPQVIEIEGTFETGDEYLWVSSNKTLIGLDETATIIGGIKIQEVENIVIQNLNIKGKGDGTKPGDAISISFSHHIWIDHCNIQDASDGNLDITKGSDFVTVSWTKFSYTDPSHTHRMSSIVGASSTAHETDEGKLNTTWHHNWFGNLVEQAMPRTLFGNSHIYNNYYTAADNSYCIGVSTLSGALIENNYFKNVNNPHRLRDEGNSHITAKTNVYDNTTGDQDTGGDGIPFPATAPYPYTLNDADTIPTLVSTCAGPQ